MRKTSIGGQALIEGLLMMGSKSVAVAIRKSTGEIIIDKKDVPPKGKLSKLPIIRGAISVIRQMIIGIKALMYSADFVDIEDDEPEKLSRFEQFIQKLLGDKIKDVLMYFSLIISLIFSVGLFILLPNFISGFFNFDKNTVAGLISYNLIEGVIRVALFMGYIILVSKLKDIKRVWQYHGAEHKTISCYESQEELVVENVRKYSTKHPRCGTSFLFTIMIISILVFSFTGWHNVFINITIRLLLVPVVAGLSYEIIKFVGKRENKISKIINKPGLFFQKFTTLEPDDFQIEVAIAAMNSVLKDEAS